jgi:four helix bundle protein
MAYQSFESLDVWQRTCRLTVKVFQTFGDCKNYAMRDQIFRSSLSVPSNIAEGSERGTGKEYARFIDIAKGSSAELRTQLYLA